MKFQESLIPLGENERRIIRSSSSTCLNIFFSVSLVFVIGLIVFRYETAVCDLQMRVADLESKAFFGNKPFVAFERKKRETGVGVGIPPWVKRTGEGEPIVNEEYRQYLQRQDPRRTNVVGRELLRSGDSRKSSRPTEQIVRNHADETFFVGEEVRPSGLKEIYERLPPLSQEVLYETPRPLEVRSYSSGQQQQQQRSSAFAPIQRVGSGADQVNARVVRFEDEIEVESSFGNNNKNILRGSSVDSNEAIAAHFVADVSNFTATQNPRLRNSNGIFQIWRPSEWMNGKWFTLDKVDGTVTVLKGGLYQIYSQIHYHDEHDENSFVVEVVGGEPMLQCTTTRDSHSCYTGGVANLKDGDKLLIKNVGVDRFSIYKPEKSFFGLIRLGNSPA